MTDKELFQEAVKAHIRLEEEGELSFYNSFKAGFDCAINMAKTKVILYDGIVPSETFDLDDVDHISSLGGLPSEHFLAVHLKDRRCYVGDSVTFKMDDL